MRDRKRRQFLIAAAVFYIFVLYFAVKAAPYINEGGPAALINGLYREIERPFHFEIGMWTIKCIAIISYFYMFAVMMCYQGIKNYRWDEEFGSAKWESIRSINKKYKTKEPVFDTEDIPLWRQDTILTRYARMGYDFFRPEHQRNLNTLIIGGSGSWKTRGYIIPNIMQMNASYVVTDPKGEIAAKCGNMLKKFGWNVKVFDVIHPEKSIRYNPFVYFRNDKDVIQFVNNFFTATDAPKRQNAMSGEKFWDDQAKNLMLAFCFLLYKEAPAEEQNLGMVLELLHNAAVSEEDENVSPVDLIFSRLERRNPGHIAVGFYKDYKVAAGKTLKSVQSTLSARLSFFNLELLTKLTMTDDIDIRSLGEKKTALFLVIPDNDTSFNFLIGTLYQQMFQQLYDLADHVYHGILPVHVRFLMDEFANIHLPDDYEKILSTARSRNCSFTIVIQDKSQLEALFKDVYKSIMGNCDELLFLGSNEFDTCEYISKECGNETIDVKEYSQSYGRNGSFTVQRRKQQRTLIFPDELRRKANKIAILIIRGEHPVQDEKYDMKKHPYYEYIPEGKNLKKRKHYEPAKVYDWGSTELAVGSVEIMKEYRGQITDLSGVGGMARILTEAEVLKKYAA